MLGVESRRDALDLRRLAKVRLGHGGKERHVRRAANAVGMHAVLVVQRAIVGNGAVRVLDDAANLPVAKVERRSARVARACPRIAQALRSASALRLTAMCPSPTSASDRCVRGSGSTTRIFARAPCERRSTKPTSTRTSRRELFPERMHGWRARATPDRATALRYGAHVEQIPLLLHDLILRESRDRFECGREEIGRERLRRPGSSSMSASRPRTTPRSGDSRPQAQRLGSSEPRSPVR